MLRQSELQILKRYQAIVAKISKSFLLTDWLTDSPKLTMLTILTLFTMLAMFSMLVMTRPTQPKNTYGTGFWDLLPVLIDFQVVWVALWLKVSPESWQNLLPLYLTMLKEKPLMILLQRIVSSHLTCGHKNTGRLILKGEKVQNMLTPRLISENLIRTEICFDVYCYEKPAV